MQFSKHKLAILLAVSATLFSNLASAESHNALLDKNKFSIGAGISNNSISGPASDETGFQFFGAYQLDQVNVMAGVKSSVEFGYMDYGFRQDSDGLWATYVVDGLISGDLGWLARAGVDFGDDSGLMVGAGLAYYLDQRSALRFEYVIRDDIDSLQVNYLFHL